jgi:hypothetical protein
MKMDIVSKSRIKAAWVVAVSADLLEIVLFPLFAPGCLSLLNDALDLLTGIILTVLVGWHFAFLPSFAIKVLPIVDIAPTWTIAIALATRQKRISPQETPTHVYTDPPPAPRQLNLPAAAKH